MADNGGLNQAFTAYKKFVEKVGREPKLPGFENYTNYQLFFIAYGNVRVLVLIFVSSFML